MSETDKIESVKENAEEPIEEVAKKIVETAKEVELEKDIFEPIEPSSEEEKGFESDVEGRFRITVVGQNGIRYFSEIVNYTDVATLTVDGKLYIGVSHYFDGKFPTECVFSIASDD